MISEFEQRLADVLGARLPAPFSGRVAVAPGPAPGAQPLLVIGVQRAEAADPDLGSARAERVPGAAAPRRVLRLRCTVGLAVRPGQGKGRDQQLRGLEAALYVLDAPDMRSGSALASDGDPGFLIESLRLVDAAAPLDSGAAGAPPVGATLLADGWFWPVGIAGQAGVAIGEIRVRGAMMPLEIAPAAPRLSAGEPPVEFTLRVPALAPLRLGGPDDAPALSPGPLAVALVGPGGRPGAGALGGGTAGAGGARLVELVAGLATISYTPPDTPATDTLIVALDDGAGGPSVEIGRFQLQVREA